MGNFIIKERTDEIVRPHHRNGSGYKYLGECIECGKMVKKTLWNFRKYPSHIGCPIHKRYQQEVAFKQYPGTFAQFIKEEATDPASGNQTAPQASPARHH